MKVLVADDEKRVCALICALIDWEGLGMNLVGTAYDGLAALKMIETHQPDLLITDIRMPGIDGLELIRQARLLQGELQFIIISGHKQFDYAQHAIKYGVAEYLLKPIKEQELNQTLLRIKKEFEEKERVETTIQELRDAKRSLRHSSFTSFLTTGNGHLLDQWEEHAPNLAIALIALRGIRGRHVLGIIQTKVLHILENSTLTASLASHEGDVYILFSFEDAQREELLAVCQTIVEVLKTQAQLFGDLKSAVALGVGVTSSKEISTSLQSARHRLSQRLVGGFEQFYQAKQEQNIETQIYRDTIASSFTQHCAQGNPNLQSLVDPLFKELSTEPVALIEEVLLQSFLDAQGFVEEQNPDLEIDPELLFALRDAATVEDLRLRYQQSLSELIQAHTENQEHALSKPIKLAKAMIDQEFCDELLSLERVSDAVHLNPSYFSGLFKKRMGLGFAEYVLEVRMTEAKKLLSQTSKTIAQVAAEVGFRDPKHFSRTFKKHVQMKPNEYRKLYG